MDISEDSNDSNLDNLTNKSNIIYCRVSSFNQKNDLTSQLKEEKFDLVINMDNENLYKWNELTLSWYLI
jgi:predicted site-specific integrase-resolvase